MNVRLNRKVLIIIMSVIIVAICSLSIAYSALSTIIEISGVTTLKQPDWNIYLTEIIVSGDSKYTEFPKIINNTTIEFGTRLDEPGDYFQFGFTINNKGKKDAMVESIIKTPDLTSTEYGFLSYDIKYEDGNLVKSKDLLKGNTKKNVVVKVAIRTDIDPSILPSKNLSLNLQLSLNIIPADATAITPPSGSGQKYPAVVITGTGNNIGDEIAIGNEHFYILNSTPEYIELITKYNLYVGGSLSSNGTYTPYTNPTGLQRSDMLGKKSSYPYEGMVTDRSKIIEYSQNYGKKLKEMGIENIGSIIPYRALFENECGITSLQSNVSCKPMPDMYRKTTYWTDISSYGGNILVFNSWGDLQTCEFNTCYDGVRVVVMMYKPIF